jgi:ApaG protein
MQEDTERKISNSSTLPLKYASEIKISVAVSVEESESDIDLSQFVFSYTVTMENKGSTVCQLVNRHWKVFSGDRQISDVKGEGVVGQQPVLRPMDSFEYTSWTIISDPAGYMEGYYTFQSEDGVFFDVTIPSFSLEFRNRSNVH